jgi:CRISPR-associated protein Cmr2
MKQFMLMFSLGPVQPFIMQARKTRDLWIGSLLLSKLMQAAMTGGKGQFVFPTRRSVGRIPDIPNKYVALFDSLEEAQGAAKQSRDEIQALWDDIWQKVWMKVINKHGDDITWDIWQRQTEFTHLFEIYWAISEHQPGMDYGEWLDSTESLLAARKRLRDFLPQNEPGEKSSISGEREILHRARTESRDLKLFWQDVAKDPKISLKDIDKEGEERLDAIDVIKRFAMQAGAIEEHGAFPSTSSIATASFIERLLECDPQLEALRKWEKATGNKLASKSQEGVQDIPYLARKAGQEWQWLLRRDGDLYFRSVYAEKRLKKDYGIASPEKAIKEGKEALAGLLKAADNLKITRPTPYYAVVQMDGDNMGMILGASKSEEDHEKISQALSNFARKDAPEIVEQRYPARLVYAGGDDVLAFAPLARDATDKNRGQPLSVLELVDELQSGYQRQVRDALPPPRTPEDEERMSIVTASIGIAIAHHYTSLSYVLRSAREAEHTAKHNYERDALVITVLRRSGEQTRVGCHWSYASLEDEGQPIKLFSRFLTLFKDDTLSPKCVYILLEEAPALIGLDKDAQKSEVKRVLLRQLSLEKKSDKEKDDLKKEIPTLAERVVQLAHAMDGENEDREEKKLAVELHVSGRRYGLVETFGWLLAMAFLARKDQEQE